MKLSAAIYSVRNVADGAAHQPLGIVHQILGSAVSPCRGHIGEEVEITLRPDLRSGDLRIHVAHDQVRNADVVTHNLPDRVIPLTWSKTLIALNCSPSA